MKKHLIQALAIYTFVLTGCQEDTIIPGWKNQDGAKPISLTSFYPESGESGIVVTIFGENFGASMSNANVTFDGINSEVLQVQPGKILVRVPLNLSQGDYQLAVSVEGQSVSSAKAFRVNGSEKSL